MGVILLASTPPKKHSTAPPRVPLAQGHTPFRVCCRLPCTLAAASHAGSLVPSRRCLPQPAGFLTDWQQRNRGE
ncbi:hypothetical protein B0I35DRAFT_277853 [Stachybotrys elegans]|uniref:Uncharacterized protein n=1 Tax=Stachybotrys elegans TaxID=80388 RepID=A0A8K0WPE7_9HYPO|nr:hypothetical protein B0I35DRAFT_277853 [Stachybotrys elegans]